MIELVRQKGLFEDLSEELNNLEDGFLDEPSFFVWVGDQDDGYYEKISTNQYFDEYIRVKNPKEINRFTNTYHFNYFPELKELNIYQIFHFNTSEYGVPGEYCTDELHDAVDLQITINENGFHLGKNEYLYSSEEEKFQLSCTDIGFYIEVVERAKEMLLEDINHER